MYAAPSIPDEIFSRLVRDQTTAIRAITGNREGKEGMIAMSRDNYIVYCQGPAIVFYYFTNTLKLMESINVAPLIAGTVHTHNAEGALDFGLGSLLKEADDRVRIVVWSPPGVMQGPCSSFACCVVNDATLCFFTLSDTYAWKMMASTVIPTSHTVESVSFSYPTKVEGGGGVMVVASVCAGCNVFAVSLYCDGRGVSVEEAVKIDLGSCRQPGKTTDGTASHPSIGEERAEDGKVITEDGGKYEQRPLRGDDLTLVGSHIVLLPPPPVDERREEGGMEVEVVMDMDEQERGTVASREESYLCVVCTRSRLVVVKGKEKVGEKRRESERIDGQSMKIEDRPELVAEIDFDPTCGGIVSVANLTVQRRAAILSHLPGQSHAEASQTYPDRIWCLLDDGRVAAFTLSYSGQLERHHPTNCDSALSPPPRVGVSPPLLAEPLFSLGVDCNGRYLYKYEYGLREVQAGTAEQGSAGMSWMAAEKGMSGVYAGCVSEGGDYIVLLRCFALDGVKREGYPVEKTIEVFPMYCTKDVMPTPPQLAVTVRNVMLDQLERYHSYGCPFSLAPLVVMVKRHPQHRALIAFTALCLTATVIPTVLDLLDVCFPAGDVLPPSVIPPLSRVAASIEVEQTGGGTRRNETTGGGGRKKKREGNEEGGGKRDADSDKEKGKSKGKSKAKGKGNRGREEDENEGEGEIGGGRAEEKETGEEDEGEPPKPLIMSKEDVLSAVKCFKSHPFWPTLSPAVRVHTNAVLKLALSIIIEERKVETYLPNATAMVLYHHFWTETRKNDSVEHLLHSTASLLVFVIHSSHYSLAASTPMSPNVSLPTQSQSGKEERETCVAGHLPIEVVMRACFHPVLLEPPLTGPEGSEKKSSDEGGDEIEVQRVENIEGFLEAVKACLRKEEKEGAFFSSCPKHTLPSSLFHCSNEEEEKRRALAALDPLYQRYSTAFTSITFAAAGGRESPDGLVANLANGFGLAISVPSYRPLRVDECDGFRICPFCSNPVWVDDVIRRRKGEEGNGDGEGVLSCSLCGCGLAFEDCLF